MIGLLAALADTYLVETAPGSMTTFVSRGSNRWPVGTSVTTTTIAGHRDMSQTACPGDFAYLVQRVFPTEVTAGRAPTPAPPATTSAPDTQPSAEGPKSTGSTEFTAFVADPPEDEGFWASPLPVVTGGVLAAGTAGVVARTMWRRRGLSAATRADDGHSQTT